MTRPRLSRSAGQWRCSGYTSRTVEANFYGATAEEAYAAWRAIADGAAAIRSRA